jgi:hypothetical protein
VAKGVDGKVESVQYHELVPMLLNEVQHQQQTLAVQSHEIAELKARLERLEERATRQTAGNSQGIP